MGKKKGKKSSAANKADNSSRNTLSEASTIEKPVEDTANDKIELKDESGENLNSLDDLNATTENFQNEDLGSEFPSTEFIPEKPEPPVDQASSQSSMEVQPLFADESKQEEKTKLKEEEQVDSEEVSSQPLHIQKPETPVTQSLTQSIDMSKRASPPPIPPRGSEQSKREEEKPITEVSSSAPNPVPIDTNANVSRSGSYSSKPTSPRPVPPTPSMDAASIADTNAHKEENSVKCTPPALPPRKSQHNTPTAKNYLDLDSEEVPGLRSFHKVPTRERDNQRPGQEVHNNGFGGLNLVSPTPINFSEGTQTQESEKSKRTNMMDVESDDTSEAATQERLATPAKVDKSGDFERNVGEDGTKSSLMSHISPSKRPETQSPISPPLPPRGTSIKRHSVPPPLEQELKSDEFRRSLALAHARDTRGTPPPINRSKRLESAAEINLIANRFRETRQSYQTEDETSRENIEKGQSALKSSFSIFLESLPATPVTPSGKFEEPQVSEVGATPSAHTELHEDELHLLKTDWSFWTQVVNDFGSVAANPEKLEQKIADGIPQQIRGIIWQLIANSKSVEFEDIYNTLRDTESPHESNIRRDMKRTKFIPENKFESLFNVIKVYSVFDPDVGYTQGMAFIVTPLLLNTDTEAEAFGLFVRLMKGYGLRKMYLPEMPGLMLMLYQFDRLLEENSPQLYNHLTRQGVRSSMYAT